ncbi:MAG: acetylglutamate kinase [Bdellovibrionota bacterium]
MTPKTIKKRIVIKLGGSSLQNASTLDQLRVIVRGYRNRNYDVVLVHGGGPAINIELQARGIGWKFIDGQRQTTPEMISVIEDVLAGQVNSSVVDSLNEAGISAVGLSGAKDEILFCTQLNEELGQVGSVEAVDIASIEAALSGAGLPTPVIAPIGFGLNGEKFNINADWAATKIAIALKAEKLIFLTDQNGILDRERKPVRNAVPAQIFEMIEDGTISGGMCTKVLAMMTALDSGVGQVRVLNASDSSRVFSRAKVGTLLAYAKDKKPNEPREVMHGRAS